MSGEKQWQGLQRHIGITGGIASGNSSVGRYLQLQGLTVLDADLYAHEALTPASQATEAVLKRYGTRVEALENNKTNDGRALRQIDRRALGKIVFNNADERLWLEQLIHPIVRERFETEINQHTKTSALVLMIPLLFEAGLQDLCTEIWVIYCSEKQQQDRLMARNNLSTNEAKNRIQAQWPLEHKTLLADHIIDNCGAPDSWQHQVSKLL